MDLEAAISCALGEPRRSAVEAAIRETCEIRAWTLQAANVRTNHAHAVVSARCEPERVLAALKANTTRWMRNRGCRTEAHTPWAVVAASATCGRLVVSSGPLPTSSTDRELRSVISDATRA
jgi:hypothetical protein